MVGSTTLRSKDQNAAPAPEEVDILLVDDRPENLTALRAILEGPGVRLTEASSGAEALREILRKDFALILLDAVLPEMDGFEVARMIKSRERSRDVPILFLTASGSEYSTIHRAYSVGAVDYLAKPIEPEIVRAKVSIFADLYRKTQQLQRQAEQLRQSEQRAQALELAQLRDQNERRYRNLAEAIPQIVWRALPDGRVEYTNQRWFDYTGGNPVATSVADAWATVHDDDLAECLAGFGHSLATGDPFQCECRLLRHDGAYRWHLRRALPERGPDGEIVAWLGTDTDIDESRRAGDERAQLLVRERAARAEAEAAQQQAAQLYVEASEAVRLRDEFLTVAGHELRTPLTTLKLLSQALVKGKAKGGPEQTAMVVRQTERLCTLVEQLLDVSCIADGSLRLSVEQIDLPVLANEVVARLREAAEQAGSKVSVRCDKPLNLEGDPLRLEQVLTNLLANAIKYGLGKPIELILEREGNLARIQVRDQGIGVPATDQNRIFDRFERAVSVREYGGLGLGLYISRQIVRAHGGTIQVASEPGNGSLFVVELLLEQKQREVPASAEQQLH